MKTADFLKSILSKSFTKPEDLEALLADLTKDKDIPDEAIAVFNFNHLTRERAINDEEIIKKLNVSLKAQNFGAVDNRIDKLIAKLSPEDQAAIQAEKNTLVRMDLLSSALDNLGKGTDVKALNETFRKTEREYKEKITGLESTIAEKDTTFEKRIKENRIDYGLKGMISRIEFAPEYQNETLKASLQNTVIDKIKKTYVLEEDEKDQSTIHLRQSVEGLVKEVYEGNKVVTLPDLLKKEFEPFIKKSGAGDNQEGKNKKIEVKLPTDQPGGKTIRQMRQEAAQG